MTTINTRADLDALIGTEEYAAVMKALHGSMTVRVDAALYPPGYGGPGYAGPDVSPAWEEMENLETIERLGFTKDGFLAACEVLNI